MKENWAYANSIEEYRFYEKTVYTFANNDELFLQLQLDFDLRTAVLTTKYYKANVHEERNDFCVPFTWEEALSELQTSLDPEEFRELVDMYDAYSERHKQQAWEHDLPTLIAVMEHALTTREIKKNGSLYSTLSQLLPRVRRLITTSSQPDQTP